jgi:hypothetical protein
LVANGALLGCTPVAYTLGEPAAASGNGTAGNGTGASGPAVVHIDPDNNNFDNVIVQPQDPALAGDGRDQSLQDGGILYGSAATDVLVGRLGQDTLLGNDGDDVILGGTEHFNPANRDRAFGGNGNDIFIWAPGDGSDFFDGGQDADVLILGLVAELEDGQEVFRVATDQLAGDVILDATTNLPRVDVTGSPGFCTVIDASTSAEAAAALMALDLDQLVRFSIRGIADAFEAGDQADDNGLRVTVHLKDVEYLICTSRAGGEIEAFDLRTSPPTPTTLAQVSAAVPNVSAIAF